MVIFVPWGPWDAWLVLVGISTAVWVLLTWSSFRSSYCYYFNILIIIMTFLKNQTSKRKFEQKKVFYRIFFSICVSLRIAGFPSVKIKVRNSNIFFFFYFFLFCFPGTSILKFYSDQMYNYICIFCNLYLNICHRHGKTAGPICS